MLARSVKQKIFLTAMAVIFACIAPVMAAGQDEGNLPVPFGTEETKKEVRRLAGSEFGLIYYTSRLSGYDIKSFYRANLPVSGWKEKGLLYAFDQAQPAGGSAPLAQALANTIVFERGKELLIISLLPSGPDGQTRFSLSQGRLQDLAVNAQAGAVSGGDNFAVAELVAEPQKKVAPVYPGASLMFLSEPKNTQKALYVTNDGAEKVAAFFKEKMPQYGWNLQSEEPWAKVENTSPQAPESYPDYAKAGALAAEVWLSRLNFTKEGAAQKCGIILSYIKAADNTAQRSALSATTITVDYEKRK